MIYVWCVLFYCHLSFLLGVIHLGKCWIILFLRVGCRKTSLRFGVDVWDLVFCVLILVWPLLAQEQLLDWKVTLCNNVCKFLKSWKWFYVAGVGICIFGFFVGFVESRLVYRLVVENIGSRLTRGLGCYEWFSEDCACGCGMVESIVLESDC